MGYILLSIVIGLNFLTNLIFSGMSLFHKINLVFQKIKNKLLSFEKLDEKIDSEKEIISSVFRINKLNKV